MLEKKRIQEWTENPVTVELLKHITSEIAETEGARGIECYIPGDPQKTQELMANLNGARDTWEIVQIVLQGNWTYFVEEEEEDGDAVLE